jgi:hypothetical protein
LYENHGRGRGLKKNYIFLFFCVCRIVRIFVNYATHIRLMMDYWLSRAGFKAKTAWFRGRRPGVGTVFSSCPFSLRGTDRVFNAAVAQLVECVLGKDEVMGSNPISS